VRRMAIAPHIADMGKARNMPTRTYTKNLTIGMVIFSMTVLATARVK
jgi:hypothetical protein